MRMKNGKLKIDYKPVELTSWQSWFMSLTTGWVTFTANTLTNEALSASPNGDQLFYYGKANRLARDSNCAQPQPCCIHFQRIGLLLTESCRRG